MLRLPKYLEGAQHIIQGGKNVRKNKNIFIKRAIAACLCFALVTGNTGYNSYAKADEPENNIYEADLGVTDICTQINDLEQGELTYVAVGSKSIGIDEEQHILVGTMEAVLDARLIIENKTTGEIKVIDAACDDEDAVDFIIQPVAGEEGIYSLVAFTYKIGDVEYAVDFEAAGITAGFGVDAEPETKPDEVVAPDSDIYADEQTYDDSQDTFDSGIVATEGADGYIESTDIASAIQNAGFSVSDIRSSVKNNSEDSKLVIVLDPGHGASDTGATRTWDGVTYIERDLNFKIASYCKEELSKYPGVTVYMTRNDNSTCPSLAERAQIAADLNADVLISMHNNSASSAAHGAEIYYPNESYRPDLSELAQGLSEAILEKLVELGLADRGAKIRDSTDGETYPDGQIADYYGINRYCKRLGIPGIIIEHAFISNQADAQTYLGSEEALKNLGMADAKAIAEFYALTEDGSTLNVPTANVGYVDAGNNKDYILVADNILNGQDILKIRFEVTNQSNTRTYFFDGVKQLEKDQSGNEKEKWICIINKEDLKYGQKFTINGVAVLRNKKNIDLGGMGMSVVHDENTLYQIMGEKQVSVDQMVNYYNKRAKYPEFYANTDAPSIRDFCRIYVEEANAEGIKAEVAFAQAMKETGFLRFGGAVKIEQFNFAGIGATDDGATPASFGSVREGVRAQIQHLKGYASDKSLNNPCVDPRFELLKWSRGCAPYVQWLGINENPDKKGWASAVEYGYSIVYDYIEPMLATDGESDDDGEEDLSMYSLKSKGIYVASADKDGFVAAMSVDTNAPADKVEYSWYAIKDGGNWILVSDWKVANNCVSWVPDEFGDYVIVAKARLKKKDSTIVDYSTSFSYHPAIKGICQMPYTGDGGGYLIGIESYDNPGGKYTYEMLILDCTLHAQGLPAWIYTTNRCYAEGNCMWTVWQPIYGYYWTLFRVYDENGKLIDEQCYGFQNI